MAVDQTERAYRAWKVLTEHANAHASLTYGELGNALDVHPRAVRFVLREIQNHCLNKGLLPLTILVVDRLGRLGGGFIAYDRDKAEEGRQAVYQFPWHTLDNPFGSHVDTVSGARRWTKNELLIILNLYGKLRFGQLHSKQPVIIDVAVRLNRTPGSVAMKLNNFASLDPILQARGIVGLEGASNLDKEVWEEFHANREDLVPASEEAMRKLFNATEQEEVEIIGNVGIAVQPAPSRPEGPTSLIAQVNVRRGQQYFRQVVLNAFGGRCGVTGIAIRDLLVASHILPWATYPNSRLEPQNGIALSRLHDGAFDRGLISFDDNYRLVLSERLRRHFPQTALEANFSLYKGKPLDLSPDVPPPSQEYLAIHRKMWDFR